MDMIPNKVTSPYFPTIANLPSGRFLVVDQGWIPVPVEFTLDDVSKIWSSSINSSPTKTKDMVIEVPSSNGKDMYKVTVQNGAYHCTCVAFGFRKRCKHVEFVKSKKQ